jgi:hypothetical protein
LKLVTAPQNIPAHIEVKLSRLGDHERSASPVQESHPSRLFEFLQLLARSRLADTIESSTLAYTSGGGYVLEKPELIEIHLKLYIIRSPNNVSRQFLFE